MEKEKAEARPRAAPRYTVDGKGAYVTSGAGALVVSHDQLGGTPGKDRTKAKVDSVGLEAPLRRLFFKKEEEKKTKIKDERRRG